jgi:bacterioferritin-associated ferredoxin
LVKFDLMSCLNSTSPAELGADQIVCHCLAISASQVADAVAYCGLQTVKEVCRQTGAGSGCTACHARLRELIRASRQYSRS